MDGFGRLSVRGGGADLTRGSRLLSAVVAAPASDSVRGKENGGLRRAHAACDGRRRARTVVLLHDELDGHLAVGRQQQLLEALGVLELIQGLVIEREGATKLSKQDHHLFPAGVPRQPAMDQRTSPSRARIAPRSMPRAAYEKSHLTQKGVGHLRVADAARGARNGRRKLLLLLLPHKLPGRTGCCCCCEPSSRSASSSCCPEHAPDRGCQHVWLRIYAALHR